MAPLIPILIGIASQVGAPIIKGILTKHVGEIAGSAAEQVIKTVAEQAGATPETLETVDSTVLAQAVTTTEAQTPELIAEWVKSQQLSNELQLAEMAKEQTWTWAWRPAWMWMLAFIWFYAFMLRPIANAAFGASIEAVDLSLLMTLTGAYLALYMGGHTAKDFFAAKWGGK